MKKALYLSVIALVVSPFAQARPWSAVKASGVINLGADPDYPPFFYQEGKVNKGFEYELGNEIARRLGVKPVWKLMVYDSLRGQVASDAIDLNIASDTIDQDLLKDFSFTKPHYCSGAVIMSKTDDAFAAAKLKESKVVYASDSSHIPQIKSMTNPTKLIKVLNDSRALSELVFGKAEAYIGDRFVAMEGARRYPSAKLKISSVIKDSNESLGMSTQKGNTTLIAEVNKALASIMKDGTYQKLSEKYFRSDIRCK